MNWKRSIPLAIAMFLLGLWVGASVVGSLAVRERAQFIQKQAQWTAMHCSN